MDSTMDSKMNSAMNSTPSTTNLALDVEVISRSRPMRECQLVDVVDVPEAPEMREMSELPEMGDSSLETLRTGLVRYCTGLTKSREVGEEIAQEALCRALPVLCGTRGKPKPPNMKAYLFRIAKNVHIDLLRRRRIELRASGAYHSLDTEPLQLHLHPEYAEPLQAGYPESQVLRRLDVEEAVSVLIACLTPTQRSIFLLRDVLNYEGTAVAKFLGTTEGAVKAGLHRARSRIRQLQAEREQEWEQDREQNRDRKRDRNRHSLLSQESMVQKEVLQAYLAAIGTSDVAALVTLGQLDTLDPVQATGRILTFAAQRIRRNASSQSQARFTESIPARLRGSYQAGYTETTRLGFTDVQVNWLAA